MSAQTPRWRYWAHQLTPPIAHGRFRYRGTRGTPDSLFDGDDALFKTLVASAEAYGEYGVGQSTTYVMTATTASVVAVESDRYYLDLVASKCPSPGTLTGIHVDIGPLNGWGSPRTYEKRKQFPTYARALWDANQDGYDLVLIDGRFRVLCLLTSLLRSKAGTKILVDDYVNRPRYHVVEEVVRPVEFCGRQALFETPLGFDRDAANALAATFEIVAE